MRGGFFSQIIGTFLSNHQMWAFPTPIMQHLPSFTLPPMHAMQFSSMYQPAPISDNALQSDDRLSEEGEAGGKIRKTKRRKALEVKSLRIAWIVDIDECI